MPEQRKQGVPRHLSAISHYMDRQGYTGHYDACEPEGQNRDRITVNYVRHELTHYDEHLAELFGRTGKEAGIFAVECERQLDARRPEKPESPLPGPLAPQAAQTP